MKMFCTATSLAAHKLQSWIKIALLVHLALASKPAQDAERLISPLHGSMMLSNFGSCVCERERCSASKVTVALEYAGTSPEALSLPVVANFLQAEPITNHMRMVTIASQSLACVDDRLPTPALGTPGGDLGEFIIALDAYMDSLPREVTSTTSGHLSAVSGGKRKLTDKMTQTFLRNFMDSQPLERPFFTHCTDDRALRHLEQQLQVENLDLNAPPDHVKDTLLKHLTEVENQGDSHIRLMLKQPDWYHLDPDLVPTVLRAFYTLLWTEHPRMHLLLLQGESNPKAFLEVSASEQCVKAGMAPLIDPRKASISSTTSRALRGTSAEQNFSALDANPFTVSSDASDSSGRLNVFMSHMDAASERRHELAAFFARVANMTPHKLDQASLKDLMDRHAYMALDTTGKRIAGDLPFFSVTYV